MKDQLNVGFLVSKYSTLFPLVKEMNLKVGFKAWKVWEDRIENMSRNDMVVIEDDPELPESTAHVNKYVKGGGIIIQLYSTGEIEDAEIVLARNVPVPDEFKPIFENIDVEGLFKQYPRLTIHLSRDPGIVVTVSQNIFTEQKPAAAIIDDDVDGAPDGDGIGGDGDGDAAPGPVRSRPAERRREEIVLNYELFEGLVRFLARIKGDGGEKTRDFTPRPIKEHVVFIHGRSTWIEGVKKDAVSALVRAVYDHLGLQEHITMAQKAPEYRGGDPEVLDALPEIYYYYRRIEDDDEDGKEASLARDHLEQAKAHHARVRAEKNWDLNSIPLFYADIARLHDDGVKVKKLYLLPPAILADKSREQNVKSLVKCFLEPLATKGIESFILTPGTGGTVAIEPAVPARNATKPRPPNPAEHVLLVHGQEIDAFAGDAPFDAFLPGFIEKVLPAGDATNVLKVLVHISVDKLDMQSRIKEYSFKLKKVDEKMKARLRRDMENAQKRLHAHIHVSRDRKVFEHHGFTVIEVEDSRDTDQDVMVFVIDQLAPYIHSKRVSKLFLLVPRLLDDFSRTVLAPLLPAENITSIK